MTVPTNEKTSVFIEKLSNANNLFSAGLQLSTGDNWNAVGVKWAQESIDASKFTHSTTSNAHQVTVDGDGDYLLLYSDDITSTAEQANPKMVVREWHRYRGSEVPRITSEVRPTQLFFWFAARS